VLKLCTFFLFIFKSILLFKYIYSFNLFITSNIFLFTLVLKDICLHILLVHELILIFSFILKLFLLQLVAFTFRVDWIHADKRFNWSFEF
jgi:hypothetical protein